MLTKRRYPLITLIITVILLTAVILFARAGGAGGEMDSGGGGGDDIIYLLYIIIRLLIELPFPLKINSAPLVIGGFVKFSNISKKKLKQQTI
jgi:hypothetical protein